MKVRKQPLLLPQTLSRPEGKSSLAGVLWTCPTACTHPTRLPDLRHGAQHTVHSGSAIRVHI